MKLSNILFSLKPFSSLPHTTLGTGAASKFEPTCQLHLISCARHSEVGPLYVEQFAPGVQLLFVGNPELCASLLRNDSRHPRNLHPISWVEYNTRYGVERGLFFKNGSAWADWRRRMQPILLKTCGQTHDNGLAYSRTVTEALVAKLETAAHLSRPYEVPGLAKELKRWAVEANLAALFGSEYKNLDLDVSGLVKNVHGIMEASAQLQVLSASHEADNETELWKYFKSSMDNSLQTMETLTIKHAHRCKNGLIPRFMASTEGKFSVGDLGKMVADLVIAAADTTAITAEWTLYLLATHQVDQSKIISGPTLSNRHLKWCLRESMRLYPVAPFLTRILQKDIELDGYTIPEGTLAMLSTYAMGRSEEYFEQPEEFWPERWLRNKENMNGKSPTTPFATLPFGFGPRSCIGRHLVEEQLYSLLKMLVFKFDLSSNNDSPVNMTMQMTGKPDQEVRLSLLLRNISREKPPPVNDRSNYRL